MIKTGLVLFSLLFLSACSSVGKKDYMALNKQALAAYHQGDFGRAENLYLQLTKTSNENAELFYRLGNTYAQQNKIRQAVASYERAVAINPRLHKAWYNMGTLQLSEAGNSFTQLLQIMPPNDPLYAQVLNITERVVKGMPEADSAVNTESTVEFVVNE